MEADERTSAGDASGGGVEAATTDEDRLAPASHERCAHHGGRPAVARCAACDEPVCVGCAVPVRGRVLGPGCVARELGDPALVSPPEPDRGRSWLAVAGALVAALGTIAPWTRTGAGDRLFGAWVPTARWSIVAAMASVALVPVAWRWARRSSGRPLVLGLGLVVVAASGLAILLPPTFQAASWGPWVTAAGGAVAAAGIWLPPTPAAAPTAGV
ncbi:MAG TPA: hypothetical protein VF108_12150 [Actinomycetota bacterium]